MRLPKKHLKYFGNKLWIVAKPKESEREEETKGMP